MSEEMPDLSKASALPPNQDSLGGWLQSVRMAKNIRLADIAAETKYNEKQIGLLESNDWAHLPQGFVLRSLVKKVAHSLGVDESIALQKLADQTGNLTPDKNNKYLKSTIEMNKNINTVLRRNKQRNGGTWIWILLLLIVVVPAVIYFLYTQNIIDRSYFEPILKWFE